MSTSERFWSKVEKTDGCWLWTANKQLEGYGLIKIDKKTKKAHRVSWELFNGEIPDGLHVLHRCDNPSCVRPNHLFLGSHQDNMRDKKKKGRVKGSRHPGSILTEKQVLEIRKKYKVRTISLPQIAKNYGVSWYTIGKILSGKLWKHV